MSHEVRVQSDFLRALYAHAKNITFLHLLHNTLYYCNNGNVKIIWEMIF